MATNQPATFPAPSGRPDTAGHLFAAAPRGSLGLNTAGRKDVRVSVVVRGAIPNHRNLGAIMNVCFISLSLVWGGLTCCGQTNGSQLKPRNLPPTSWQRHFQAAKADSIPPSMQSPANLLAATDSENRRAAFAFFEHAAPSPFTEQDSGGGVSDIWQGAPVAVQESSQWKGGDSDLPQASAPAPIADPLAASEALFPRLDSKEAAAEAVSGLRSHTVLSLNQSTSGGDDRHLAAFRRFDAFWKPPPASQNQAQRRGHSIFWTDPNVVTSPVGFSGSQLWQRTFDPRASTWTTPRIPTP